MEQFKTWEEMSDLEQAAATWWDLYKDVHGVRPRGVDTSNWTLEGFNAQIKALSIHLEEVLEDERQAQAKAIEKFEERLTSVMRSGNSRQEVIKMMMDSQGTDDFEYFSFIMGLPYGYFSKAD
ncbi:MAG: hypothetical protein RLZZ196_695 [Bacteroidota bacterium]|jgi:endonuclease/exonuclease/phosphatase family metal-dependent hydrolase